MVFGSKKPPFYGGFGDLEQVTGLEHIPDAVTMGISAVSVAKSLPIYF